MGKHNKTVKITLEERTMIKIISVLLLLVTLSTTVHGYSSCSVLVRNDNDCRIFCQLMTNCKTFTWVKNTRTCYPKKQSGWTKITMANAISGRLDFHSNEVGVDYRGGDLPEPC